MNALAKFMKDRGIDEEVSYALAQGYGQHLPDPDFYKARRHRQNLALRGYDTYEPQQQQPVNALFPIMSGDTQASFLRSEKDLRPYYETDHRGMVAPLIRSGYNDAVALANPGITGGSAPSVLNDIIEGRQVAKGEIEQAAGDAAGAAMTGSLAASGVRQKMPQNGAIATQDQPNMFWHSGYVPELPPPAPGKMRVFHGSPFDDLAEIKTPAFHSEHAGVAREYRDMHGGGDNINGLSAGEGPRGYTTASKAFSSLGGDRERAISELERNARIYTADSSLGLAQNDLDAANFLRSGGKVGKVYASDVDPPTANYFDSMGNSGGEFLTQADAIAHAKSAGHKVIKMFGGEVVVLDPAAQNVVGSFYANAPTSAAAPSLQHIAQTAAREQTPGIRAYHGSPHDFDKFDLSKIGTGEGAQAFGHGLYFAESEGVAKSYKQKLSMPKFDDPDAAATYFLDGNGGDRAKAIDGMRWQLDNWTYGRSPEQINGIKEGLRRLESGAEIQHTPSGRMYEINIKADPADFLDWDKPLSQQSEKVRQALGVGEANGLDRAQTLAAELEQVYANLAAANGSSETALIKRAHALEDEIAKLDPSGASQWRIEANANGPEASKRLREAGIPGIKYLDQGSRTAGEGSRNYVVFDDALVEILRKYGLAGLSMLGGATAMGDDAKAEQPAPLRATDDAAYEGFMRMLGLVNNMGQGYQPGPVQSDYVQDRRNEDPEGVYQSDRVAFRRRIPSADGIPPDLRFLLPRP